MNFLLISRGSMKEIMTPTKCYIKGEQSNAEKKVKYIKGRATSVADSLQQHHMNYYTLFVRDMTNFQESGRPSDKHTPLNTRRKKIWCEVLHSHDIPPSSASKLDTIGLELDIWCKYYKVEDSHEIKCSLEQENLAHHA